eukprot:gene4780-5131_t
MKLILLLVFCVIFGAIEVLGGLPRSFFTSLLSGIAAPREELIDAVKKQTEHGTVVVIKYGGHAMENDELKEQFLDDIAEIYRLGISPVIVHGGGPQIAKMLKDLQVESKFIDGLRVTDAKTLEVAQMILCGSINKDLARRLGQKSGIDGVLGLSGLDSNLIVATVKDPQLGLVGEPIEVNAKVINKILDLGYIPIIAPIATNNDGSGSLNVNADTAAGAIAEALQADKFLLFTDISGVLDKQKNLIDQLPVGKFDQFKEDGTISGGMIPKLETAVNAVKAGVGAVHILDGRVPNCILRALSGDKFGTTITK